MTRTPSIYQWSHPEHTAFNFGDGLTEWIIRREFGLTPPLKGPADADLFGVGSVLEHLCVPKARPLRRLSNGFGVSWRPAHIWGSGFLRARSAFRPVRRVVVHAVRGPLSHRKLDSSARALPYGDPGLLVSRSLRRDPNQEALSNAALVLVPHYVDRTEARSLAQKGTGEVTLVDVMQPIEVSLAQIAQAQVVVSSSLHGLVVADAFGIPSVWVRFGRWPGQSRFKFADYFLGTGGPLRPCLPVLDTFDLESAKEAARAWIDEAVLRRLQDDLLAVFPFARRAR